MRNFQVSEDYRFADYGQAPDALPSLAAIKSRSNVHGLPAFSSFVGSPSSLQQGGDCSLSQTYHQQSQFEELAFWQSLQKQQNNIGLPGSLYSQPLQQHLRTIEPLKPSHKQHISMEPPWINHSQFQQQNLNFTERPLKIGEQHSQEVPHAISPSPCESQSQRLILPGLRINEGKSVSQKPPTFSSGQYLPERSFYKGKEKVTSFSTDVDNLTYAINERLALELSRSGGRSNALYSVSPELEYIHQTPAARTDVTLDREIEDSGSNSLMELMEVLKECSPPGPDIPDPYGDSIGPLFDIPFFSRITGPSGLSGLVSSLKNFPLPYNAKDLHSRKGKQVLNMNSKRRI
ncbi:hypothetical protein Pint_17503 [Pistacia integerrima]|uniref:Uncharacterized protein n=1 Tax=Pistacia integerrima TaxID=434235 RepID=A0ACC0Z0Y1_9ROSI|nr:hypothetical protein Pint_17503 [Pistacia integerrima]